MTPARWHLPEDLLAASFSIMQPHGALGNEGLALWFGRWDDAEVHVTHVVEPHGPGFRTSPYHLQLSLRAMFVLTDLAEQIASPLVGQIHSHPVDFLDLSDLDQEQGIRTEGYLSLVHPHYAQKLVSSMAECGVYVFERGRYRRLPDLEIDCRLVTVRKQVAMLRCLVPA